MGNVILRPAYVEQIKIFIDKPFVKIITGMRRCGKSELLKIRLHSGNVGKYQRGK